MEADRTPVVALVGRPNVGKSTLFNRYAGQRRALVANQPGLTRDRIAERIQVEGREIWLVDTAGLDAVRHDDGRGRAGDVALDRAVQAQARSAVEAADAILFVVDGLQGLLPEDEAIARTLRRAGKPLGLIVNKIDHPMHHGDRVHDFHRLGIPETFAVSAEHGGGAFDALETIVERLPGPPEPAPEDESQAQPAASGEGKGGALAASAGPIHVAIVGRPNVGKSSTANRLAGEERVVVAETPGTTRDAIDIRVEHAGREFVFVDTAGIRKIAKRRGPGEHGGALMTLKALERAEVALLLVDAEEGCTDQDARVASLLREHGCAALVLANKWDRVPRDERRERMEDLTHGLRFIADVPVLPVSAKTGQGYRALFDRIEAVARAGEQRIATADLNRWLQDVAEKHPPSMASKGASRRPNKLFYASQVGVRPPTVIVFCTDPKAIQTSYVRFLENRLRESFGFEGTPVRVKLRQRSSRRRED